MENDCGGISSFCILNMGKNQDHGTWSHLFMASRRGKCRISYRFSADNDYSHEIKTLAPWEESYDERRRRIKKQSHHFAYKGSRSKAMAFPGVMYGYENCIIKKAEHQRICFQTVVLEKTLESPLDCKSASVHPKGNQP